MSNQVILNSMEFKDINGHVSYGYTISDNEDQDFNNSAKYMIEDDIKLLEYVVSDCGDSAQNILDFVKENEKGMLINDNWYDWNEIKETLNPV